MYTAADVITAVLLAVLVVLLGAIGLRSWRRSRIAPDEKERRRRMLLLATGQLTDANLVEIGNEVLVYSYAVRGAAYTATQDISQLKAFLPGDLASLGRVCAKYDPRNPANSMVLAEQWSGLQTASPFIPAPRK